MPPPETRRPLVVRVKGTLFLIWNGSENTTDDEWSRMLAQFRAQPDLDKLRILVVTEGGAPPPSQQKQLYDVLGGRAVTVAILADGVGTRFVISSLALFIKRLRGYRLDELGAAAAHLSLTRDELTAASAFLVEMGVMPR